MNTIPFPLKNILLFVCGISITMMIVLSFVKVTTRVRSEVMTDTHVRTKKLTRVYRVVPKQKGVDQWIASKNGEVIPIGGNATPQQHNEGDTRSNRTSWTMSYQKAWEIGHFDQQGMPRDFNVHIYDVDLSNPKVYNMVKLGLDMFNEQEVQIPGKLSNLKTIRIMSYMTYIQYVELIKQVP